MVPFLLFTDKSFQFPGLAAVNELGSLALMLKNKESEVDPKTAEPPAIVATRAPTSTDVIRFEIFLFNNQEFLSSRLNLINGAKARAL
jgi:hypothetical protein